MKADTKNAKYIQVGQTWLKRGCAKRFSTT